MTGTAALLAGLGVVAIGFGILSALMALLSALYGSALDLRQSRRGRSAASAQRSS